MVIADVLVPSLLVIDSPRKAFGNNAPDRQRATEIYSRFRTLANAYGDRLQLIIADNDPPPVTSDSFGKVEIDYEKPHGSRRRPPRPRTGHTYRKAVGELTRSSR
ncbi:hypothetical protein ACFYRD_04715 [Streptomyces hirsutus]|uniref:hypothetical protein n=1 Tax=Streptomyces hirsutus TaxID=35620 RepID=UPI003690785D